VLNQTHPQIANGHMSVEERGHEIQFLYTLKPGAANRSYGIHVARLAGLPERVVARAETLLGQYEKLQTRRPSGSQKVDADLPLFQQNFSLEIN
jgi:DNA mismatch repair protein MutS